MLDRAFGKPVDHVDLSVDIARETAGNRGKPLAKRKITHVMGEAKQREC